MADKDRGRVDYDPVIQDTFMLEKDETRPAGCAVCWAGCLPRSRMINFPENWTWLSRMDILTDESLLCVNDGSDGLSALDHLPHPVRIGGVRVRLSPHRAHHNDAARRITSRTALCWFEDYFILPPAGFLPESQDDIVQENLDDPVLEAYNMYGEFQPWFCVPVHKACWGLLQQLSKKRDGTIEEQNLVGFYDMVASSFEQWSPPQERTSLLETPTQFHEMEFISRVGKEDSSRFSFQALFQYDLDWESYFLADPLDIGMYTQPLLANAPRLLRSEARTVSSILDQLLSQLPQELLDQIFEQLCPLRNLSTKCSRTLSPRFWRSLLFTPGMFPWLWDLDEELVMHDSQDDIDWESFVRSLAQPDAFERLEHPPRGLRNRHSIWQRLEPLRSSAFERANANPEEPQHSSNEQAVSVAPESIGLDRLALTELHRSGYSWEPEDGCFTEVEVTWNRRTQEEEQRQNREDDYQSGRWTLEWRRVHSQD